jgi:hypothetical protein
MTGLSNLLALIGLAALSGSQPRADLPAPAALRDATYSVGQADMTSAPSTNPSQISVALHSRTGAMAHLSARVITSDTGALALQTAFTERPGKSLEPQVPASGASDEYGDSWLDLILMLCLALGLLAYQLIRRQTALRQSSKLAS